MKFDLKLRMDNVKQDKDYQDIGKKIELSVNREDFIEEYEKDSIQCTLTLREMYVLFYSPYSCTAAICDETCSQIYKELVRRPELISFTAHIHEVETYDLEDYRKASRHIEFDFTLNTTDKEEHTDIFAV